ncbi:MAG: hypothetical protein KIT36_21355 [Alphaproteobacteria bacterium]|nr:hypothetical protein [Alphaproteobacteria bacterium]
MTNRIWKRFAAGAGMAVVAMTLFAAAPAMAQNYGCACLHNRTGVQINFRYRWGDGEWKVVRLPANYNDALCWNYGGGPPRSPPLTFQLDTDMTGGTSWSTYTVNRVQSPGSVCSQVPSNGHYDINYRAGTNRTQISIFRR